MNGMDLFKRYNSDLARKYDIYDTYVKYDAKVKNKTKKLMRKRSRSKLKQNLLKEYHNDWRKDSE